MPKLLAGSWEPIIQKFLFKVQNSAEFFEYFNLTEEEAMELARLRAKGFLVESVSRLTLACTPDVDFHDYDYEQEQFGFDITSEELDLLASLMFEMFMGKDFGKLTVHSNILSSQDIKAMYNGPNERNSFANLFKKLEASNNLLIDSYASKDRLTGIRKPISSFDM